MNLSTNNLQYKNTKDSTIHNHANLVTNHYEKVFLQKELSRGLS